MFFDDAAGVVVGTNEGELRKLAPGEKTRSVPFQDEVGAGNWSGTDMFQPT